MSETNPYESPKTDSSGETVPVALSSIGKVLKEALQLLGIGVLVGAFLGILACGVLSGGRAAYNFYLTFGVFGAVVGIVGGAIGGVAIGIMRLATGTTAPRPPRGPVQ
jgi:hypothetical protein